MKKKHTTRFKYLILMPLCMALVVLLAASTYVTYRLQRMNIDRELLEQLDAMQQKSLTHLAGNTLALNGLMDFLKRDTDLQKAWVERDRKALLHHALPLFQDILSRQGVTHFYFIDPDKSCFLRIHNPDYYGDRIQRVTLDRAELNSAPASGVELGPFGTLTYRVVHPWWIGEELTGFIELGVEIDRLARKLKEILRSDLIFTLHKSYLNRTRWEQGLRMMKRRGRWDQFSRFVIVSQTLKEIPPRIDQILEKGPDAYTYSMSDGNRRYRSEFLPLTDAANHVLGEIVLLRDITAQESSLRSLLLIMLTASIFVGALLSGFFYFWMDRVEGSLLKSYRALEEEIVEREKVEKALQESREMLEGRVLERTMDLKAANARLEHELRERKRAEEEIRYLSHQLISGIEEERRRIARDLHDEFGQALSSLYLRAETLQNALPPELKAPREVCAELIEITDRLCDEIRHYSSELRPDILEHLGLIPALESYIEDFVKHCKDLEVDFRTTRLRKRPDREIEMVLYRIVQEGLTNISRHARARHVDILLAHSHPNLILSIKDDGVGFNKGKDSIRPSQSKENGIGLIGMRERVASVGGTIHVYSREGRGTIIRVELPVSL